MISRPGVLLEELVELVEVAVLVVAVEAHVEVPEVVVLEVVGTITMMTATEMPEEADVADPPEDEGLQERLLPRDEEEVAGRLRLHRHLLLLHEIVN